MRHALCAATALAVLLGAASVRGADEPRSPLGPLDAQEGDWTAYSGTFECAKTGEPATRIAALWTVEKVTDAQVVVVQKERFGSTKDHAKIETHRHAFARKEAPTLDAIFSLKGAKLEDVKVADKTATFSWHIEKTRFTATATFAAAVRCPGIEKLEIKGEDGSVLLLEAKGWGTKEKTLSGQPADEVVGAAMAGVEGGGHRLACPKCGLVGEDEDVRKCPKDGSELVRSDLLILHTLILELAKKREPIPGGYENPFLGVVKKGEVDVDALEKLIADYKAVAKKHKLQSLEAIAGGGGAGGGALVRANEAAAIGALKTICTSEAIFREGDKDQNGELDYGDLAALDKAKLIDSVLGSGKKQGYVFVCEPGRDPSDKEKDLEYRTFHWYATASPQKPGTTGERYFFTNQTGVIYYSMKPFEVTDKKTCKVPDGLVPVGR